ARHRTRPRAGRPLADGLGRRHRHRHAGQHLRGLRAAVAGHLVRYALSAPALRVALLPDFPPPPMSSAPLPAPVEFAPGLALRGVQPPLALSDFRLIAFDMDSTLITIECIDEIADAVGKKAEVAAITEATMRGEIKDFKE